MRGQHNKIKSHKGILELTLEKYDAEIVTKKVQDHKIEAWYDVENKSEEIVNKLTEVKDALEKLQLTTMQQKEQMQQQTS
jgi:hypothetical protein